VTRGWLSRTRAIAPWLLVTLLCSGCGGYNYTFLTGLPASQTRVTENEPQALFGWVSNNVFDLDKACPGGAAEFGSYIGFVDWLEGFFTLGLYTPRTAYAVCAEPVKP
jgi:Bor protein